MALLLLAQKGLQSGSRCPGLYSLKQNVFKLHTQTFCHIKPQYGRQHQSVLLSVAVRHFFRNSLHAGVRSLVKSPRNRLFALTLPGLGFLQNWKKKDSSPNLSQEVLSNIPKEILRKEVRPKKKKRNIVIRFFISFWENVHYVLRFMRIVVTFVPLLMVYPVVCLTERTKRGYWHILLYCLESLGATFIKLGQWAGTRRDLFSPEFCDLFSKLHVRTWIHSWQQTKRKLKKSFGKRWREILIKVHKRPIGSGCIAQVYKAYMPADMIPDEALVEEILEDIDEEPEIDFADGLEIMGLGSLPSDLDDISSGDVVDHKKFLPPRPLSNSNSSNQTPTPVDPIPAAETQPESDPDGPLSEPPIDTVTEKPAAEGDTMATVTDDDDIPLVPVALKVLHPGVYRAVKRDLQILGRLVWLTEKLFPSLKWISLSECMAEFSELLIKQIDLRMEAECLEEFNQNFSDHPNIRFPRPVWPYCKRGVLIETFEEGEPLSNYLLESSEAAPDGLKEKLATYGVDALLQMIFVDNFVHGDLHPGNILVQNAESYVPQEENKLMLVDLGDTLIVNVKSVDCPVKLVLLDVGITSSLSQQDLDNFKAVFTAVIIGEGSQVAELMLRHSSYNECSNVELFKEELGEVVMKARQDTISLGKVQVGKLLSDVFSILIRHKVKVESNFASILLAIFVLEGLGRSLDPELDILEYAKPILLS